MSYTALDSIQWGGTPKIGVSFGYDSRRSGGDMQYRIYVTVAPLTGAAYFGYPIYLTVYVDGDCVCRASAGYGMRRRRRHMAARPCDRCNSALRGRS